MIKAVVTKGWLDQHDDARLVDVRWYLDGRDGRAAYEQEHLPGAVFIDLEQVLAAEGSKEQGRHPLPDPETFAEGMRAAGINDDTAVVAYDDAHGMVAGRLVWLLRALGHDAALLDGGIQQWSGHRESGNVEVEEGNFTAKPWPEELFADMDDLAGAGHLVDVRAPERYRGDNEPVDGRAGHIPGAINLPNGGNLSEDGTFLSPDALKTRFAGYGIHSGQDVVAYCGSGISACHVLLAMEHAGLGQGRLYPGSWSQWSATDREIETGDAKVE